MLIEQKYLWWEVRKKKTMETKKILTQIGKRNSKGKVGQLWV